MLFSPKESSQGLVEYVLIILMILIIIFAAVMVLGPTIGNVLSNLNNSLPEY